MKRLIIAAVGLALVVAVLGVHGSPIRAQPVASIALPSPGATKQLYEGCNNISLTFPDGTTSQTLVQAVTPAGSVESLWRHDAALKKWDAFSPAAPAASDLLQVNFLDSVWLCIASGLGTTPPPPGPTATLTATPTPPPPTSTPAPMQADLAVTDLFPQALPAGPVVAKITNNGPDSLTNANVDLSCQVSTQPYGGGNPSGQGIGGPISVTLNPGQTAEFPAGFSIDISQALSDVTCIITVPFNDPNPGNNNYAEKFPTADVEVADFILQGPAANREVHAVLRSNGPGTLAAVPALLECESRLCPDVPPCFIGPPTQHPPVPLVLHLTPSQTVFIQTPRIFNDNTSRVQTMTCTVVVEFNDPVPNNTYNETPVQ